MVGMIYGILWVYNWYKTRDSSGMDCGRPNEGQDHDSGRGRVRWQSQGLSKTNRRRPTNTTSPIHRQSPALPRGVLIVRRYDALSGFRSPPGLDPFLVLLPGWASESLLSQTHTAAFFTDLDTAVKGRRHCGYLQLVDTLTSEQGIVHVSPHS